MFLVDTNVLSELRRPARANPNVAVRAGATDIAVQYVSSITILELMVGAKRKERSDPLQGRRIRRWIEDRILVQFEGRILAPALDVVLRASDLHVPDPRPYSDSLIAATALVHGLTLVTRNTRDFQVEGLSLLDPWQAQPHPDSPP